MRTHVSCVLPEPTPHCWEGGIVGPPQGVASAHCCLSIETQGWRGTRILRNHKESESCACGTRRHYFHVCILLRILSSTLIPHGGGFGLNGCVHSSVYSLLRGGSIVMLMVWSGYVLVCVQTDLGACPLVRVAPDWSGSVQGMHFRKLMLPWCLDWLVLFSALWSVFKQVPGACTLNVRLRLVCSGLQTC